MFSLFDLVSSFNQITAYNHLVPLAAFCTPAGLYEWLVMPQGSSASPGWFVKVINEVIKGLENVVANLDDVIVFDSNLTVHVKTMRALFESLSKVNNLTVHVKTMRALFESLRKHNLELFPSKARLGATDADFFGHSISPAGVRPNAGNKSALIKIHAAGSKADACPAGWCGALSQILA